MVHGAAFEDPSIGAAIRSLKSIPDQVNNYIVGKGFVLFETSCQILSELSITFTSDSVLEHLSDLNIHKFVFLCDFNGLLFSAGAGWSQEDHTLGSAGSLRPLQFKNARDLLQNLLLALGAVKFCDQASAYLLDALHVHIALADGVVRILFNVRLVTLDDGVITSQDVTNSLN